MTTRNNKCARNLFLVALGASASLFTSGSAQGALISPGAPPTATSGAFTFAGMPVLADESFTVTGFDVSPVPVARYTATVESQVLQDPAGTLDFAYQVNNSAGSLDSIDTLSVTSYSNFTTNIDYVSGTGGVTYATVGRLAVFGGITVTFNFTGANVIPAGVTTDWIIIKTSALKFDTFGGAKLIDGATATVSSFQPTVPEPISLGLLGLGGCVLLSGGRQRRSRSSV